MRELRQKGKVIEPLKDYHKDEVRELGTMLGLPEELVWRQPFPGPGLTVRILCTDKPFQDATFASTNEILMKLLTKDTAGLDLHPDTEARLRCLNTHDIAMTLLPIQTVGVQGDGRTYNYAAAISGRRDWKALFELAKLVPQVS